MAEAAMQGANCSWGSWGFEPATFRLLDDPLSYSRPNSILNVIDKTLKCIELNTEVALQQWDFKWSAGPQKSSEQITNVIKLQHLWNFRDRQRQRTQIKIEMW